MAKSEMNQEPVPNPHYDIIAVMYHALKAVEVCQQYLEDARGVGDDELSRLFESYIEQNRNFALQAQELFIGKVGQDKQPQAQKGTADGVPRH